MASASIDEFLDAIDTVREQYGACTYEALAQQLGIKRPAVHARVQRLVAAGKVTVSALPGSIRRAAAHVKQ